MISGLYVGSIRHERYIPRPHRFAYPFFMWFLNLDQLDRQQDLGLWFSLKRFALSRFYRSDYLGDSDVPLATSVRRRMEELTGSRVNGEVCGLLNLRTLGLYFSPVNFYFGFDQSGSCSHFLAEVSNTPWNERHHYAFLIDREEGSTAILAHDKQFHVSPFNPDKQNYRWRILVPGQKTDKLSIQIAVHDQRGHIFDADLDLHRQPLTIRSVRRQLIRRPAMTVLTIAGIYWQALRLFLKKVPYVPYQKEQK